MTRAAAFARLPVGIFGDASGNIGIGTSSPAYLLDVAKNTTTLARFFYNDGTYAPRLQITGSSAGISLLADYNTTAGNLILGTNNTERMRIDSSGNVGIGCTPSNWTSVAGKSLQIFAPGNSIWSNGAGTVSTTTNAQFNGGWYFQNNGYANRYDSGDGAGAHIWSNTVSGTAGAALSWVERMRLDSSGNLLVGTTTIGANSSHITVGGDSGTARVSPRTDNVGYVGDSGQRWQAVYAVNGTIQTSDGREKNTIEDSNLGLSFVNALRPVSYKWNVGENLVTYDENQQEIVTPRVGVRTHYGFIAQEVKAAIPEGVDFGGFVQEPNDGMMSLRYHEFIGPLVKAIQEQQAIIEAMAAKLKSAGIAGF